MASPTDTEYKIITAGGRENGPLDVDTIRGLFARKLIDKNTLVYSASLNQWLRLEVLFDLSKWETDKTEDHTVRNVTHQSRGKSVSPSAVPKEYRPSIGEKLAPWLVGLVCLVIVGSIIAFFVKLIQSGRGKESPIVARGIFIIGLLIIIILVYVIKYIVDDRKFKRELAELDQKQGKMK